jgi:uridine kinase
MNIFSHLQIEPVKQLLKILNESTIPFVLSIAGGSCSGKTSLSIYLKEKTECVVLPMDSFYKPISKIPIYSSGIPAFDHPNAFEIDLLSSVIQELRRGHKSSIPIYQYYNLDDGRNPDDTITIEPGGPIIIDGILSYYESVRHLVDYSVFLERDPLLQRQSRISKDFAERGVTRERSAEIYDNMVTPLYKSFVLQQKSVVDLVISSPT